MRYKRLTAQDPFEKAKRGSSKALRQWSAVLMTSTERRDIAKFRSRSHDALIRVYDEAGNVIETHEHAGDFKEW
jgi:hypothetical protein